MHDSVNVLMSDCVGVAGWMERAAPAPGRARAGACLRPWPAQWPTKASSGSAGPRLPAEARCPPPRRSPPSRNPAPHQLQPLSWPLSQACSHRYSWPSSISITLLLSNADDGLSLAFCVHSANIPVKNIPCCAGGVSQDPAERAGLLSRLQLCSRAKYRAAGSQRRRPASGGERPAPGTAAAAAATTADAATTAVSATTADAATTAVSATTTAAAAASGSSAVQHAWPSNTGRLAAAAASIYGHSWVCAPVPEPAADAACVADGEQCEAGPPVRTRHQPLRAAGGLRGPAAAAVPRGGAAAAAAIGSNTAAAVYESPSSPADTCQRSAESCICSAGGAAA